MSRSFKIIGGFAAVGFLLPMALTGYFAISGTMAGEGTMRVCPSCMLMIALDSSSTVTALVGFLIVCVSNAVVYALPGIGVAAIFNLVKRTNS